MILSIEYFVMKSDLFFQSSPFKILSVLSNCTDLYSVVRSAFVLAA